MIFGVAEPLGDVSSADSLAVQTPDAKTDTEIRKYLRPLKGAFWRQNFIRSYVEDFYTSRGLVPTIKVRSSEEDKSITIQPSPRISRVLFSKDDLRNVSQTLVAKLLYLILADKDFRRFVRQPDLLRDDNQNSAAVADDTPAFRGLDFADLGYGAGSEPLFNSRKLQRQQMLVNELDFQLTVVRNNQPGRIGKGYFDLLLVKQKEDGGATKEDAGNVKPIVAAADENGVVNPNLQDENQQTDFGAPTSAGARKRQAQERRFTNCRQSAARKVCADSGSTTRSVETCGVCKTSFGFRCWVRSSRRIIFKDFCAAMFVSPLFLTRETFKKLRFPKAVFASVRAWGCA